MLATGFPNWAYGELQDFVRAIVFNEDPYDIEQIASEIESKTIEEVAAYHKVFLQRYHELDKEQIGIKLSHVTFNRLNKQTIEEFDDQKSQVLLL